MKPQMQYYFRKKCRHSISNATVNIPVHGSRNRGACAPLIFRRGGLAHPIIILATPAILSRNCTRNNLKRPKIQKFSGRACPQTPLAALYYGNLCHYWKLPFLDPPLTHAIYMYKVPQTVYSVSHFSKFTPFRKNSTYTPIICPPQYFSSSYSTAVCSCESDLLSNVGIMK